MPTPLPPVTNPSKLIAVVELLQTVVLLPVPASGCTGQTIVQLIVGVVTGISTEHPLPWLNKRIT